MFSRRPSKTTLRKSFEERVWKRSESFSEYVHDKIILANEVPIQEEERLYYFEGIPDIRLKDQARIHRFQTVEDLLSAFEQVTLSNQENSSGANSKNQKSIEKGEGYEPKRVDDKVLNMEVKCYNCRRWGHLAVNCEKEPRKRGSCYVCASEDHIIKDCPRKQERDVAWVNMGGEEEDDYHRVLELEIEDKEGEIYKITCRLLHDSGSAVSFIEQKFINLDVVKFLDEKDDKY